jgi:signal transduction histidine kinase
MQRLVEQLFTLTRADEGRTGAIEDVDVNDVVLAEVARVRRAGLAVEHHLSPQRVRGSSVAWSQMVRNLVDNAVRHAAERVDLTVSAEGDDVVVLVDDDGAGVPEADRERIFDRFVRLDEARSRDAGGSGLGLAIVRDLARAQGGSVRVESSPIGGARFVLRVPRGDSA